MPVNYVLVPRGNPAKPKDPKKLYAQFKSNGEVDTRQLVKEISARSTISAADAMAVVEMLLEIVPEKLAQGQIVRLGALGSFSASLTSEGVEKEEQFVASTMIRGYKIRFRPSMELAKAVASLDYRRVAVTSTAPTPAKKA